MAEQSEPDSADIEGRMAAIFAPPAKEKPASEAKPDQPEQAETQEEAPTEEDDGDDLEVEGAVYRVPKELKAKVSEWKEGSLRQADYTRKTQELADLHRQAQSLAETVNLRELFEKEVGTDRKELDKAQFELEQYKQVDLSALDEATYRRYRDRIEALREVVKDKEKAIGSKKQEFSEKVESARARATQEAINYLSKAIPKFDQDALKEANDGALGVGFTNDELKTVLDARFAHLSWKAAQYDKLKSGKSAAVASVQKAPPVVKPGATQTGTAVERKYQDARERMRKNPNDLRAAASVFLIREKAR